MLRRILRIVSLFILSVFLCISPMSDRLEQQDEIIRPVHPVMENIDFTMFSDYFPEYRRLSQDSFLKLVLEKKFSFLMSLSTKIPFQQFSKAFLFSSQILLYSLISLPPPV
ncbi:MAG TPA: hypothetical protein PL048_23070 [Leptospiraceae bacterium]|nr:hypothetical protein [Leptospiraceae bacterium]HMZ61674.1 hypothetical protein [Leptospiraceae bacterium]HNF14982.1 hypothetical protein [Leptospiraceae bacterium]HNF27411.1 hypothetical protein [Leptospiraceae bacterium]HNH10969.1 hypothetical protein [Leptospiraceae bacterium]